MGNLKEYARTKVDPFRLNSRQPVIMIVLIVEHLKNNVI